MKKEDFKKLEKTTPLSNSEDIYTYEFNSNLKIYLKANELKNLDKLLIKKGNCSTNDAVSKVAYGDVYASHALPFYLYNFSALKIIDRFIPNKEECSVLELGCNNGHVSRLMQRNGFRFKDYWGVDFDFSFILDGLQSNETVGNFCSGDFNKPLNFLDESFDLIYFQEAFDHCRDRFFYAEQCLSELKRVLKPGGFAYISLVFEHEDRDLYHWDHNYIWSRYNFDNIVRDYFKIVNFVPLLTFEETMKKSEDKRVQNVLNNWPSKFAKMVGAHFVDGNDVACAGYMLRKL